MNLLPFMSWHATPIDELERVLDRRTEVDSLRSLISALSTEKRKAHNLADTAIVFDSSVFLRLGAHKASADIVDYLTSAQRSAPLIIPGQSIQEFWNNQLQVVDTMASSLKKKYDQFKKDVEKVGTEFSGSLDGMEELLSNFDKTHGYLYDEVTARGTLKLLESLRGSAMVPYVPRLRFKEIAAQRKLTKTPPGFRDDGDGDFFIWADALYGLQRAKAKGCKFSNVALVTEDKKLDWSRNGVAHPILISEVSLLLDVEFQTWTLERLNKEVTTAIGSSPG